MLPKSEPFISVAEVEFSKLTFCNKNASTDHDGCAEQASHPSPTTSATMADKLFIFVSRHEALFDTQDAKYKNDDLEDIWLYLRSVGGVR